MQQGCSKELAAARVSIIDEIRKESSRSMIRSGDIVVVLKLVSTESAGIKEQPNSPAVRAEARRPVVVGSGPAYGVLSDSVIKDDCYLFRLSLT